MMDNVLVSVAIITYNHKEFLREAIESVLAQNYQFVEIVIGDDCSTDGTQDMLREYEQNYPEKFILCLSDSNKGITANSNAVHFACTGKYIAWLGGDDLMLQNKIKTQVDFLENNPDYNIVYHNLEVFDSASGKAIRLYNNKMNSHEGDARTLIKYGTFNGACATMVRHSASPAHGFDTRIAVASDWLYWIEHLGKGGKIGYINQVLGRYRRHSANVSGNTSQFAKQGHLDGILTADILEKEFPRYKKIIDYRRSILYRGMRKIAYKENLLNSLKYNIFNVKSGFLLLLNILSFNKIKL